MGYRRTPFAPGEFYHIFSRGIDKRVIFKDVSDFERFKKLLYLANDATRPINLELIKDIPYRDIFTLPRSTPLVGIAAYCLMSNHPHLVLREREGNGITKFMHKVGTAFTAYFNKKYDRIGNLMVKPFRSKHIDTDTYLRQCVQYVHLNPVEIFEPNWKAGNVTDIHTLEEQLRTYPHSSLMDYIHHDARPESQLLDSELMLMMQDLPPLSSVLHDARTYYQELDANFEAKMRGRKPGTSFDQPFKKHSKGQVDFQRKTTT